MMGGIGLAHWAHGWWMVGGAMLIVVGLAWLVWYMARPNSAPDAERLVHRRYAAGEIDEQEYRDRLYYLWKGRRASQQ